MDPALHGGPWPGHSGPFPISFALPWALPHPSCCCPEETRARRQPSVAAMPLSESPPGLQNSHPGLFCPTHPSSTMHLFGTVSPSGAPMRPLGMNRALLPGDNMGGGALAGSRGLLVLPIMANCGRGGSGLAPCGVLSSLCASCPLHNGLRKLDRGQVIGLEIDNNKTGPAVSGAPLAATGVGIQDRLAGEKPQGPGRCPSGTLAVSEQTPTSSTDPFCHYDGPPSISMLGATEGPCQSNSRAHPPLLQHLCCALCLGEAKAVLLLVTTGPGHFPIPLTSGLPCLECSAGPLRGLMSVVKYSWVSPTVSI